MWPRDTRPPQSLLGAALPKGHTRGISKTTNLFSHSSGEQASENGVPTEAAGEGPSSPFPASGGSRRSRDERGVTLEPDGARARALHSTRRSRFPARCGLTILILLRLCPGTNQFNKRTVDGFTMSERDSQISSRKRLE